MGARIAVVVAAALALPATANATLVYERASTHEIFAANDDGSNARVVAHGRHPVVAPNGKKVAYFVPKTGGGDDLAIVRLSDGRLRRAAHGVFSPLSWAPSVWSPNSRYLAVADSEYAAADVVDSKSGKRRRILVDGDFGAAGAAFSPDSRRIVIDSADAHDDQLYVFSTNGRRSSHLAPGQVPVWSRSGLVYRPYSGNVLLRRRLHRHARLLLRPADERLDPIAWSGDAKVLLVGSFAGPPGSADYTAKLLRPSTGEVTTLSPHFSQLEAVDRHGQHVLGEAGGDVVEADRSGSVTVLAHDATSPSWTR